MKKVRVIVTGRVQGVWFRSSTQRQARALGLAGYVRNLPDGNVEVVVEGKESDVDRLLDWARVGPPGARVDNLDIEVLPSESEFQSFEITY